MKKFFSLLALVGVLAACQKEDLKTAFKVDPGVATVNATAVSIDGKDITSDVVFSYNGVVGGTSQKFESTSTEAFDQEVTVSAVWTGHDGKRNFTDEKKIRVHVLPGGTADYNVKLTLGEIIEGDFTYEIVDVINYEDYKVDFYFLTESESHAVAKTAPFIYDGVEYEAKYLLNPTEFLLRGTLNYVEKEGIDAGTSIEWTEGIEPYEQFVSYCSSLVGDGVVLTPASLNFTVSGFAMYCAYHGVFSSKGLAEFHRINKGLDTDVVVATFNYTEFWGNEAGVFEDACIGHEAHYVPGHGHDDPSHSHGHGSSNAGGGIVYAD